MSEDTKNFLMLAWGMFTVALLLAVVFMSINRPRYECFTLNFSGRSTICGSDMGLKTGNGNVRLFRDYITPDP